MTRTLFAAACLGVLAPLSAHAQSAADIQSLRDEIQQLRTQYEARLKALETKLEAAQAVSPAQAGTVAATAATPPPAPAITAAATGVTTGTGTGFNPAISLILSGLYTHSRDPSMTRGFSVGESELGLSANIDPWFSGTAAISFDADNNASVEEAYVQTTSLGNGLTLKAGRYFSSIGYLNSQHAHVWDFVDALFVFLVLLGG